MGAEERWEEGFGSNAELEWIENGATMQLRTSK
jgi:hypothetical protein